MLTIQDIPFLFAMLLFAIGLYAIVAKKNLIKIIVGVVIIEYSANLFLLLVGYRSGGIAPILDPGMTEGTFIQQTVDPLPQAMILTSIVIGLGTLALIVSIAIRLYEKYGTFDVTEMKKLRG